MFNSATYNSFLTSVLPFEGQMQNEFRFKRTIIWHWMITKKVFLVKFEIL